MHHNLLIILRFASLPNEFRSKIFFFFLKDRIKIMLKSYNLQLTTRGRNNNFDII